ncbi:3-ketoacyl-ACP reductase [Adhaeretor mobilis]|uniref:3-oxoacyl-[acyl-carrier-protein] reductase FabG n=1 Tax=Adhaeretor mobilis TaxID=1930276 RepID=A0A517N0B0_9BACT|nr:3-ketoacyl-ACP reductase [Adhaeretor mobilis]QDT00544.1 3-oxoacyl-[acyl-carrier-protein] reductase FabG [Adhaeretor mobilis]
MSNENNVALVTGGSRGIGLGICKALVADGWNLAVNGMRDEQAVSEAMASLRTDGAEVIYCQGNVADADARAAMLDQVEQHFGRLNLLVNNAGITSPGRKDITEATEEGFDQVMAVNLKGPYFLTQLTARWMLTQGEADESFAGTIVNISSVSAAIPSPDRGDYCISRAGTSMATKLWARRLGPHGINVYEIRPGVIRTDMTAVVTEKYDRLIEEGLLAQPRWGTTEDVGQAVALLASGKLSYATGNTIHIDGGLERLRTL